MSTSPTVMNLPEGYTLEQPNQAQPTAAPTPQPAAPSGGMNLPEGYTLEQPATTQTYHGLPEGYTLEQPGSDTPQLPARQATHYDGSKMGSKVPNSILNGSDSTGEAIGGLALGGGAALLGTEAAAPAMRYIATEWGAPAVKALQTAAEAHPIVAKVIAHGLTEMGMLSMAKYMKLFGK